MTDEEIRAEIDKRVIDQLSAVAARFRKSATQHGPVVAKVLNLAADDLEAKLAPEKAEGSQKDTPEKTVADEGQPGGD